MAVASLRTLGCVNTPRSASLDVIMSSFKFANTQATYFSPQVELHVRPQLVRFVQFRTPVYLGGRSVR